MYFVRDLQVAGRVLQEVEPCPPAPPASSKPGTSGARKCVAIVADELGPPRVSSSALRSIAATAALRTLTLSNGLIVVFSAM